MDLSFSGILAFANDVVGLNPHLKLEDQKSEDKEIERRKKQKQYVPNNKKLNQTIPIDITLNDLCFSLQETIFSMLTEVTERAMAHCNSEEVLIVGGVGCNERLQKMIQIMAEDRQGKIGAMKENYCVDNGAMIAYTGLLEFQSRGATPFEDTFVTQSFRTDEVEISWRSD